MTFEKLSEKQKTVLRWCHDRSNRYSAIICDGAVRSGKTSVMIVSFILWAMRYFNDADFAICGKTVRSAERNIIVPLQSAVDITEYYDISYTRSTNVLTVIGQGKHNRFYVFGGRDESSYTLIQGITLSGVFLDEVALMPRSFVEQAIARTLSVAESKLWFNCNPESPMHWFYLEWIKKAEEKNALHLHFLMYDNPIMAKEAIDRAESLYQGVFYDRYIKGLWVQAEGLIYTMFNEEFHVVPNEPRPYEKYYVSIDYGTINPTSMGLWGLANGKWYRIREYYFDSRNEGFQKTDEEHYQALEELVQDVSVYKVIVDPSAASFIECIRRHEKFYVEPASNRVLDGIRDVATQLRAGNIFICENCKDCIREFGLYRWDEKAPEDRPIKTDDHSMDDIRYFVRAAFAPARISF